jgi:hypothetical protein
MRYAFPRRCLLLVALATATLIDRPIQAQRDPSLCSIKGIVTNALTDERLRKAFVRLVGVGEQTVLSAVTDAEGTFALESVKSGNYQLQAEHQGFIEGRYSDETGETVEFKLTPGEKLGDLNVRLMPQGVISGRVVDEDGDIWLHSRINLYRSIFKEGRKQLQGYDSADVDDQGQFRIARLPAGKYFLSAEPDESWESKYRSGAPRSQPVWYPNSTEATSATPIIVSGGQEISSLEMRVHRGNSTFHRIRGKVSGLEAIPVEAGNFSKPRLNVSTTADGGLHRQVGGTLKPDGLFEIPEATSGMYEIVVHQGVFPILALGHISVEVDDRDVEGISLEVKPPRPLEGTIRTEGDDKLPLAGFTVSLVSLGYSMGFQQAASRVDGSLQFQPIADEPYRVLLKDQSTYYLKLIRYGNAESRDGTFFLAATDATIELVLGAHPAVLTVRVKPSGEAGTRAGLPGQNSAGSSAQKIVLIPDTSNAAQRQFGTRKAVRNQNGVYGLEGVAPGAYRVFAFENIPDDAWTDSEFLEAVKDKGVAVRLEGGDAKTIEVPLLPKSQIAGILTRLGVE